MTIAIVTGAAGALGGSISRRLAHAGHEILMVDVSDRVHETAEELCAEGFSAHGCVTELGGRESARVVAAATDTFGSPVAVLVNNAGINRDARAANMTDEHFREVVRVDLSGPATLCQEFADRLGEGGSVINVSSRAAFGNFGQTNYVAAKAGLIGLTRALAVRWAPKVRVNAVAPGLIDTPMTAAMPAEVLDRMVARIPAERMGTPEEVAEVVAFLASPAAAYITGQVLPVCGGRSVG